MGVAVNVTVPFTPDGVTVALRIDVSPYITDTGFSVREVDVGN
jgi:hypothetical protein